MYLPADQIWFRTHYDRPGTKDRGCWWHASLPARKGTVPGGRFDLAEPFGTCYLANAEGAAVREFVGHFLAKRIPIPREFIAGRAISAVRLPEDTERIADLLHPDAARAGVTGEIHTINDYRLTTEWAAAAHAAGHGGLRYQPRFTPGGEAAIALFGPAGAAPDRAVESTQLLAHSLAALGYDLERSRAVSAAERAVGFDDDADIEET